MMFCLVWQINLFTRQKSRDGIEPLSYNGHEADLKTLSQPHNKYRNSYF